jgi:hypothetical protein
MACRLSWADAALAACEFLEFVLGVFYVLVTHHSLDRLGQRYVKLQLPYPHKIVA